MRLLICKQNKESYLSYDKSKANKDVDRTISSPSCWSWKSILSSYFPATIMPNTTPTLTISTLPTTTPCHLLENHPSWKKALSKDVTKLHLSNVTIDETLAPLLIEFFRQRACSWESIQFEYCARSDACSENARLLRDVLCAALSSPNASIDHFIYKEAEPTSNVNSDDEALDHRCRLYDNVPATAAGSSPKIITLEFNDSLMSENIINRQKCQWIQQLLIRGKSTIHTFELSIKKTADIHRNDRHDNAVEDLETNAYNESDAGMQGIAFGLQSMECLHALNLSKCNLSDKFLSIILDSLNTSCLLQLLDLSENEIGPLSLRSLSRLLTNPSMNIQKLHMSQCFSCKNSGSHDDSSSNISSITPLANALRYNQTLQFLNLSSNSLQNTDFVQLMTSLLHRPNSNNSSLKALYLHDNDISDHGIKKFLIDSNSCCDDSKSLNVHTLWLQGNPSTIESGRLLLDALKDSVLMEKVYDLRLPHSLPMMVQQKEHQQQRQEWFQIQRDLKYFGKLNQAGRRLLKHDYANNIPISLWPFILERINRTNCFYETGNDNDNSNNGPYNTFALQSQRERRTLLDLHAICTNKSHRDDQNVSSIDNLMMRTDGGGGGSINSGNLNSRATTIVEGVDEELDVDAMFHMLRTGPVLFHRRS